MSLPPLPSTYPLLSPETTTTTSSIKEAAKPKILHSQLPAFLESSNLFRSKCITDLPRTLIRTSFHAKNRRVLPFV
jgi:hypothetical protein